MYLYFNNNKLLSIIYYYCTVLIFNSIQTDVVAAIKTFAFKNSPYPVILSIENHCCLDQQKKMADIFKAVFGKMLLKPSDMPIDFPGQLPSPDRLKYKILLKGKRNEANFEGDDAEDEIDDDDYDEYLDNEAVEPSSLSPPPSPAPGLLVPTNENNTNNKLATEETEIDDPDLFSQARSSLNFKSSKLVSVLEEDERSPMDSNDDAGKGWKEEFKLNNDKTVPIEESPDEKGECDQEVAEDLDGDVTEDEESKDRMVGLNIDDMSVPNTPNVDQQKTDDIQITTSQSTEAEESLYGQRIITTKSEEVYTLSNGSSGATDGGRPAVKFSPIISKSSSNLKSVPRRTPFSTSNSVRPPRGKGLPETVGKSTNSVSSDASNQNTNSTDDNHVSHLGMSVSAPALSDSMKQDDNSGLSTSRASKAMSMSNVESISEEPLTPSMLMALQEKEKRKSRLNLRKALSRKSSKSSMSRSASRLGTSVTSASTAKIIRRDTMHPDLSDITYIGGVKYDKVKSFHDSSNTPCDLMSSFKETSMLKLLSNDSVKKLWLKHNMNHLRCELNPIYPSIP